MLDLTVIILTFNEEKHIERCLRSIKPVAQRVVVVDSFSTDRTVEIACSLGATVLQRTFKNHADQFQWGVDQCQLEPSAWVMRMDADEYLEPALVPELQAVIPDIPADVGGLYLKRKVFFMGQWIRHGGFYPQILLRVWRHPCGRIEQRWMDEHIVMQPSMKTLLLKEHIVDDNHKGITFWINKHNSYASREMVDLLSLKYGFPDRDNSLSESETSQAKRKRVLKQKLYARLPIGVRAFAYFIYRYIFCLGFLDGKKGFFWHFMQGFWYRLLVDLKLMEIEARCGDDIDLLKQVLQEEHGIRL